MAGFIDNFSQSNPNMGRILRAVSKIGSFGMEYKDLVVRNSQAIGVSEAMMRQKLALTDSDEDFVFSLAAADTTSRKYIAYFDKDYPYKRDFLRSFALNPEIEWILDILADEAIVYDDRNFCCSLSLVNMDLKDDVADGLRENFRKIYVSHGFNNGISAWQYFRQFLIDGFLSFEIVYSDNGKSIVGFKELDPVSLTPSVERMPGGNTVQIWYQYYGDSVRERKLYDSQVIYISFANGNSTSRTSYVERLIRSHNLLKIMEHTRIIWNVMNASFRLKMTIPVGSRSPQKAKETLGELMNMYKEDIKLNTDSGELSINGRPNLQFYKNYLFPVQGGESPKVETINSGGPNLNVIDAVVYFFNKLKADSKIPFNRFAARSGGTVGTYKIGAESAERDEIRYNKFINRIRSIYQEILLKPLWIQMTLDHPELEGDTVFRTQLGLKFNSDNQFGESKEIEQLIKKIDFIAGLSEIKEKKGEEELPYFSQDFLIDKFLGLTNEDRRVNLIYKKQEEEEGKEAAAAAAASGSPSPAAGGDTAPPATETGGDTATPAPEPEAPAEAPAAEAAPAEPAETAAP
jgi:hypothetical protein